jgi:hypothetical protein
MMTDNTLLEFSVWRPVCDMITSAFCSDCCGEDYTAKATMLAKLKGNKEDGRSMD